MDGEGGSQQGAEPSQAQGAPPPGHTFLGGEVGPARRQAAQPVPADLHQALVGRLLQHRAALPPEGLPPPQAELAPGRGSRWGAALLVPRKAAETKSRRLLTGSPSEWLTSHPCPPRSQQHGLSPRREPTSAAVRRLLPTHPPTPPPPPPRQGQARSHNPGGSQSQGRRRAQESSLDPHPVLHKHLLHRPRPDEPPPGAGEEAKQAGLVRRRRCHQPDDPRPTLAETEKVRRAGNPRNPRQHRSGRAGPKTRSDSRKGPLEWDLLGGQRVSPRLTAEAGPLPLPLAATTIKSLTPDGALGHDTVLEPPLDPRGQRAGKVTWVQ